ncbi:outer membrane biosynthesis protein TonB [Flavobacterium cheniae]|jgi:outer membrane biosynthesis protein TonB|uniref:Outer membrane biosynthesis protein TonB n=2 Tax=Flavobacterium cheniae TaxID=295428 RepID=A0A562KM06_9FLAO|nr:outer membrane biosynthesis protein TonB [Flavobacterium cheniae]TWH96377.1 outer membrane biosynthesis protein TonB [Flavobacterium cheniae]
MRFVFLLFISFLFVNLAVAQDKNMSTQDRLKELARIKKESDEQKKKEWDAYLVRVEESKIAKQQKKQADSIEKSKVTTTVVKDDLGFTKCTSQELPYYKVKNLTTGLEEQVSFNDYIRKHIYKKFRYPEFAMDHEIQGRVLVYFIIDKEGNPQINDAVGPKNGLILEEEAARIIKSLPTAIPANCDGKPINISYAIPIMFQMEE